MATFNCINCGFNGTDRESLRVHPCLTSSENWRDRAIKRLTEREAKAESRRDEAEDKIQAIIGDDWQKFTELRNLFSQWEEAEIDMGEATERIVNLESE